MAEQQAVAEGKKAEAPSFPLKVILGQKVGMTQIFSESGERIPVSVIFTGSCAATQLKTQAVDGYDAIQLGIGECKEKNLTKPLLAQFQKKNLAPLKWLKEFKLHEVRRQPNTPGSEAALEGSEWCPLGKDAGKLTQEQELVGKKVPLEIFSSGDYVDVSGVSKGKGFAGTIKRHGFHGGPASHGASDKERAPGSNAGGSGAPQRVLKGTRMAGRMGAEWVTSQKLEVVKVDKENQLILVRGAIPGVSQGFVIVKETSKELKHKRAAVVTKTSKKAAPTKKGAQPAAKAKA